jgi:cytochrome oxidase Cu insertion factor (SCO1/SenC/PrrC family)
MTVTQQPTKHNRAAWILIILAVIFIGPMIAAWSLYTDRGNSFLLGETINYGQLVQPPLDFTQFKFRHLDNSAFTTDELADTWWMVYITPGPCNNVCQKNLYKMRQVWIALGKDQDRVQRLLITFPYTALVKVNSISQLQKEYPGMQYGKTTLTEVKDLFANVTLQKITPQQGALYLVDPHGNLMMAYAPDADPEGLLKDLTRLLNTSQIG